MNTGPRAYPRRMRRPGVEPENTGSQRLLAAAAKGDLHDRALWTPTTTAVGGGGNSTALVGTPDTVAQALLDYIDIGVETILIRGYDPLDDAIDYGRHLLPLVREELAHRNLGHGRSGRVTAVATPLDTGRTWKPAAGTTERGHIVLFAGRGEHAGVYERFGRRLAFDGYRVSAVSGHGTDEFEAVLGDANGLRPLILAGSDTGALQALATTGLPSRRSAAGRRTDRVGEDPHRLDRGVGCPIGLPGAPDPAG